MVIAERAGTSKQAVNHVLRDLERLGYVELRSDPRDSRARLVVLTARGHALVEAMFDAATAAERELESTSQLANGGAQAVADPAVAARRIQPLIAAFTGLVDEHLVGGGGQFLAPRRLRRLRSRGDF